LPSQPRPYLSIVITGRNDNFGGDFNQRLIRTLAFNDRLLAGAGVPYEIVFVEWRPIAGQPRLGDELRRLLPQIDERLTTIDVDTRYHDAFSQNPRLEFHEFIAKNVGIRRASGSYILATNTDIHLSRPIIALLARRELRPMILYRATRVDLKTGIDTSQLDEDVFAEAANQLIVNTLTPPRLTNGAGDFLLLDRFSWHQLRGFNEVYRVAKIHIDANFCMRALAGGLLLADTGAQVFHVGAGTFLAQRGVFMNQPAVAPWGGPWHKQVLYENPSNWGIADAPAVTHGPRRLRLDFADRAVPPLVSLRRITGNGLRGVTK